MPTHDPTDRLSYWALLALGVLTMSLSLMRFGLAELAWVAFAPFLVFAFRCQKRRDHLALLGAVMLASHLALAKIITHEVPAMMAPMFGVPIGLTLFATLEAAGAAYRRLGPRHGAYVFAAATVGLSYVQYELTGGASWGALAHTQVENLPLVQLASLTGIGGISLLVSLGSGLTAVAWNDGLRCVRADLVGLAAVVCAAALYGHLRLANPSQGPVVRVGSVVSPIDHRDFYAAIDDLEAPRKKDAELLARTERAIAQGAQVVVWNEAATVVSPQAEPQLIDRTRALAEKHHVAIYMAYGTVLSTRPLHWINQYRVFGPDGAELDHYRKRHPVPGDGDDPGTEHARVLPLAGAAISGAICYDYSYPEIARDNARDGANLVLVPASDWRGIDPLHARMAAMNAVAAGLPMVRPVRAATSLATDAYGRTLGELRADAGNDGVMVVDVRAERLGTLYARTGEAVPVLAWLFCGVELLRACAAGRMRRQAAAEQVAG